jgi:DNA-binding NtrC family response regulator
MSDILVVSTVGAERVGMLGILRAAGYRVRGAASFGEATHLLATFMPDLVIADERLHAYNGMHVLLRARSENPHVGAIVVTAEKTRGVEDDARRLNMEYAVRPEDPAEWLAFVARSLDPDHSAGGSTAGAEASIQRH